jgi:hypothetical protein
MKLIFGGHLAQSSGEALEEIPVPQIFGCQLARVPHEQSKAKMEKAYKLIFSTKLHPCNNSHRHRSTNKQKQQPTCRTQLIDD